MIKQIVSVHIVIEFPVESTHITRSHDHGNLRKQKRMSKGSANMQICMLVIILQSMHNAKVFRQ